jgi:hypothetical protein
MSTVLNPVARAGLVVLAVISLGDLTAPLTTDGEHPPMAVALVGTALGALSLLLVALAWRGRTAAALGVVVLRILSVLTAVPAFLVSGVPTGPKILAGVFIALTLAGAGLVLAGLRRPVLAAAR